MKHIRCIFLVFICVLLSGVGYAEEGENVEYGLVKQGSFLLSIKPDTLRDGLLVHSLVGYLPTGTRVIVKEKHVVTNLSTSNDETYYYVKSDLGIRGLIREDLLIQAKGRKLAVSIASYPIPIHRPNATLQTSKIKFTLGRYGGNYLEITGESTEGFYDVVLHRSNHESTNLPETEEARLKKLYVKTKQVSLLDPEDESLNSEFGVAWSSVVSIDNDYLNGLIETVRKNIDGDFDKVKAILGDINNLQCLMDGSVNGELGFKVFSNGFSLNLDTSIKEKGVKYIFEGQRLYGKESAKYYSGIGVIKCDGLKPIRMESFTIQENMYSDSKRFSVSLADLENSKSKWISTLQDASISNKMVRISGWDEYNQLIKELNEYATRGNGYLSTLPEKARMLLLNYIVSRIGFFEHRDLIIDDA